MASEILFIMFCTTISLGILMKQKSDRYLLELFCDVGDVGRRNMETVCVYANSDRYSQVRRRIVDQMADNINNSSP